MLNLVNSIIPVLCLCIGFFVGYKIQKKEKITLPEVIKHPHNYIKTKIIDNKNQKKAKEELDYLNSVLYNIENYDGTGKKQKTIKRGISN